VGEVVIQNARSVHLTGSRPRRR